MPRARVLSGPLFATLVALGASAPAQTTQPVAKVAQQPAPRVAKLPLRPAGANPTLRSIAPPSDLKASLASKKKKVIQPSAVGQFVSYRGKTPFLRVPSGQFQLEPADLPGPTTQEIVAQPLPQAIQQKYGSYIGGFKFGKAPLDLKLAPPPKNDHRGNQSPIRNQQSRGTCVAHAAIAAIEAAYKKRGDTVDLSENHAYNTFMPYVQSNCFADQGVPTWKSAAWLSDNRICTESESPYVPDEGTGNCAVVQLACQNNRRHGFTSTFPLFGTEGGAGILSINNTNALEAFIDAGYDIVGGFYIAGVDWSDGTAESGVIDVQMINVPGIGSFPVGGTGGHAMSIVGYDRPGQYFIVKNSWGAGWGHAGYAYLSYDYVQTYAKYGYVVMGVTNP